MAKTYTPFIILMSVNGFDRTTATSYNCRTFESWEDFWTSLRRKYPDAGKRDKIVLSYTNSEFVEACNNKQFDLKDWWVITFDMNSEAV